MITETLVIQLELLTCGHEGCGIVFGVPTAWSRARRSDHKTWYCPNGHSRGFPHKSREEDLADQLKWAKEDAERQRARRETAERSASAARGQVTKIKNRVAHGVCPCCKRSFENLARHMAGQHPEFVSVQRVLAEFNAEAKK